MGDTQDEKRPSKAEMDGAQLLLYKDGKRDQVFLVRRNDIPVWQVTGGGIELGEESEKAALREAEEETGFKVKSVKYLGVFHLTNMKGKVVRSGYIYEGRVLSGDFVPEFTGCLGEWFSVDKLPTGTSMFTKKLINAFGKDSSRDPIEKTFYYNGFISNIHMFFLHPFLTLKYVFKMESL